MMCISCVRNWGIFVACCAVVVSLAVWSGMSSANGSSAVVEDSPSDQPAALAMPVAAVAPIAAAQDAKPASAAAAKPNPRASEQTVLITGANRGLGLEFARQFAAAGYNVIATARKPEEASELKSLSERVRVMQLDVTAEADIKKLADELAGERIDMLINNAGVGGWADSVTDIDFANIAEIYAVNTIGPMRMVAALHDNLVAGERKLIVSISSGMGSIGENTRGGGYGYRESKAALNMFTRSLAAELKDAGFTCIVMSPGWVRTDMGGEHANLSPEESIRGMINVIEGLKKEDTGSFFSWKGEKVAW